MTKLFIKPNHLNRDEFLTPFDKVFDELVNKTFPTFQEETGVSFNKGAYPKVNIYEYDDKVGIVAEIPGLDKKDLTIEVTDGNLTISGEKHSIVGDENAKVLRRELKGSSFKRSFALGDNLNGDNIKASFKNGVLNIDVPKVVPEEPKKTFVKIS